MVFRGFPERCSFAIGRARPGLRTDLGPWTDRGPRTKWTEDTELSGSGPGDHAGPVRFSSVLQSERELQAPRIPVVLRLREQRIVGALLDVITRLAVPQVEQIEGDLRVEPVL